MWGRLFGGVALAFALALASGERLLAAGPTPIFGAATGETDDPGQLTPTGHGRFAIQDRVYVGRSLGRSVEDDWAACFSGRLTSTEDWALESGRMSGSHASLVTIGSERVGITLRLRGQMERLTASGSWEIVRGSGPCADLDGEGSYTATYANASPQFRLTFDGQVRP